MWVINVQTGMLTFKGPARDAHVSGSIFLLLCEALADAPMAVTTVCQVSVCGNSCLLSSKAWDTWEAEAEKKPHPPSQSHACYILH